jgi:hypothetical protein
MPRRRRRCPSSCGLQWERDRSRNFPSADTYSGLAASSEKPRSRHMNSSQTRLRVIASMTTGLAFHRTQCSIATHQLAKALLPGPITQPKPALWCQSAKNCAYAIYRAQYMRPVGLTSLSEYISLRTAASRQCLGNPAVEGQGTVICKDDIQKRVQFFAAASLARKPRARGRPRLPGLHAGRINRSNEQYHSA